MNTGLAKVPKMYREVAKQALELAGQKKWNEMVTLPSGRQMTVAKACSALGLDPEGIEEDEE